MDRHRFDESIVIAILSGGIVTVLSNAVQFNVSGEVGGLVAVFFALGYAIYRRLKNKSSSQDSTTDKTEKSQPNNQPTSSNKDPLQNNNKTEKHFSDRTNSIIRNLVTLIVIGAIGYIGFYAYQAYEGTQDTIYTYTPPTLHQETFFTGKIKNFTFTIPIDYTVHLNTTSLSAQNEIDVDIRAVPSIDYKEYIPNQWQTLPQHFYMIFPDAKKYPLKHTPDGSYFDAMIIMNKTANDYRGIGKIYYLFEGKEEGYTPMSLENLTKYNRNGVSYLNVTDLRKDLNPNTLFSVGTSDNTTTLHTNHVIVSLTYILVAFGILEFRGQLIKGVIWLAELLDKGICRLRIRHRNNRLLRQSSSPKDQPSQE